MEGERPRWEKGSSGRARRTGTGRRGSREAARGLKSPTDVRVMEPTCAPGQLLNGQLLSSGISILDRLIKTCPVWLQLCMGAQQAVEILRREASGVFLVTRDVEVKGMVLWVRLSECREAADVLRYNIREEKTMVNVEGSVLVFKDIFKLVAFYCVSRDILPSVLKLPPAISGAQSLLDLEEISNLGTGFWDSSLKNKNPSSISQSGKSAALGNLRSNDIGRTQHGSSEFGDCTCEIEISAGNDRMWFVSPIFIEECSNVDTSKKLPLMNCIAKPEIQKPKVMHRRPPPPPPPTLHKPPLPSVPPSAPPPNYIRPQSDSCPLRSPTQSGPSTSECQSPSETPSTELPLAEPPKSETTPEPPTPENPTEPPPSETPTEPPPSETPTELPPTEPPTSETHSELPPAESLIQYSSSEPPQSLNLCSLPNISIPNPVDLPDRSSPVDHPTCSTASDLILVPSPDLLSATESSLASSPSTSISFTLPSQTHSQLLSFTSNTKDQEDHQVEGSPVPSTDVDLLKEPVETMKINVFSNDSHQQGPQTPTPVRAPPAVPRRRQSGKGPENKGTIFSMKDKVDGSSPNLAASKPDSPTSNKTGASAEQHSATLENGKKSRPVPPPRTRRLSSRLSSVTPDKGKVDTTGVLETETLSKIAKGKAADRKMSRHKQLSNPLPRTSNPPLPSHGSDPTLAKPEADSYSTSSAEEDSEPRASASIKKSQSFMLDRAKNRLSIVSITNVFTAFMSADRKLQKKITELAHDKDSYFGNLVQDYKAYSLEMMAKQSSSTEMLQEIRLMMTQLKSYLVQSTELKSMVDHTIYTDDRIDTIVEAALCKCVLKPLKSAIECYLREIHNKDGSLRLLTENQQVIQETTTTDLGVTTSVPDSSVMEKILQKFSTMHKTYSPEKKITYLLKACKLIYDSMAAGNPGKPHGADDFLPVLMYVLAQCDLVALLLDVEYMMELMDPALQLGEGSYYLTTTYGALEHIKNYDKITVTRQLSLEVQDSIHRWERRRTLNKAKVSRSSIQDFITISFEELDSKTRTLATKPDMSVAEVVCQCAEKFEVSEPDKYGLFVLVNDRCVRLADDAFPQQVKCRLLKNEQKLDFHFLYKRTSAQDAAMNELDFL
ncbi:ras and Rab interactor 3 isoform X1 [Bufo gargarizans]|uniref:ras and Rab interactor 3 isoform X1 n=1 Tax=Bufo gargarizans TaxID=30331 RepID=UPI001CF550FD|nr:ras and Rab interactor 3 isoform X1 [Bufo gargarizans]